MYLKENMINIVKRAKRMAELFAFGEFWRRLSHLGKFNTCQWHSACTKSAFGEPTHARPIASELAWRSLNRGLGHSKDLITLSLSGTNRQSYIIKIAGDRASIYGFLCINARKAAVFFISITQRINNQNKQ